VAAQIGTGLLLLPVIIVVTYLGICTLCLLLYRVIYPPATMVQIQRYVESLGEEETYVFSYRPTPGSRISDHLKHAVVAAEDGRFYEHNGIDWQAVQTAMEDNRRRGRSWRGGSTITQQLVKNLFMTTHRSLVRKVLELPLAYAAEFILPKERILVLYLNVIEWDHGVFGAEAAARRYYNTSAAELSRQQSAALAACIPNPRQRSPQRMGAYAGVIMRRMSQMGW
jgi:monofunctional glycosyltransferase